MTLQAKLTADALKGMGLTEVPKPRYEDLPAVPDTESASKLVNHWKACQLIDPILTAKFSRFIPDVMIVDQTIDTTAFRADWSVCLHIDITKPPSVNPKITRVTGIRPVIDDGNFMLWLGRELENLGNYYGTFRIGPPQVFRTKEMMGVIVKFDRSPKTGQTIYDKEADIGLLLPQ